MAPVRWAPWSYLAILIVANQEAGTTDQQTESTRRRATGQADRDDCGATFGEVHATVDGFDFHVCQASERKCVPTIRVPLQPSFI